MDREPDGPIDPRRAYTVDVSGVGGPRNRSGLAAAVALVVVVAIVAGGIVSGQLFPVPQIAAVATAVPSGSASAGPSSSASAAAPASRPPGPVPSGPLTARLTASPVDVMALVASIPGRGTGPLAFVAGHLTSRPKPCEAGSPLSACLSLRIDGLRDASVVPDDSMLGWPGDPGAGETLVLLPRDGKLVFLGSMRVDPRGIPRIDVLKARVAAAQVHAQVALYEADGVLYQDRAPCIAASCGQGEATLLATPPAPGGVPDYGNAQTVGLGPQVFGVTPGALWTTGPFLVRYVPSDPDLPWRVVAREDQGSILHVVIP
jgi:hypothetical protein